eukprot:PhF_6_TR1937/c1_g1_i2/m.3035
MDHYRTVLCEECQNQSDSQIFLENKCKTCQGYLRGEKWSHWKPSAPKCHLHECQATMGEGYRRSCHNCRVCGNTFCDLHATTRDDTFRLHPKYGPLVRVCKRCSTEYDRILRAHYYASKGLLEQLRLLLLGNPHLVNTPHPRHHSSLLYIAAKFGHVDICRLLIKGYDVPVACAEGPKQSTALHAACYFKQNKVFQYLMEQPFIVYTYKNAYGETAFDNAKHFSLEIAGHIDQGLVETMRQRCEQE